MIGAGKTTYVSFLAETFASQAFYESVDENPILSKFYAEPETYGFMSQMYYLAKRFDDTQEAMKYPRNILDRCIYEDVLFAEVNHDLGRISEDEKSVYDTLANTLIKQIETNDSQKLYIYLKASFETILKRISMRDRSFEQDPALVEYYRALHMRYDDWMKVHVPPAQLLTIQTDSYDVFNKAHQEEILKIISMKMVSLGL